MKRKVLVCLFVVACLMPSVFAGGSKEAVKDEKILRVADNVPGLITPGVWDGQTISMNSSIYEYLVEMNPDTGEIEPVLATEWSTPDGKEWIFTLRKGVTYHDGSSFDSTDVKFSIERTQDPKLGHLKKQEFEIVQSVEAIDPHTVIITLQEQRPMFIYQLMDYNMAMLSSDYDYAQYGESKPMGTGPFKVSRYIPKESVVLEKNPSYWNPELPKIDKLLIYFVADIDASISMLEDGRVDIVPYITPIIQQRLAKIESINVVSPYQEHRFISMNVDEKPWGDNRVRLAFKYAMDPHIIAKSISQMNLGEGVEYNETPLLNIHAQFKEIPLRGRDIEKAKSLLAEAGYPHGVTIDLYFASDYPFSNALAQTVQELASPAGFKLKLKGNTRDIYLSQYWLNVPLSITGWGGRVDPSMMLTLAFKGGGAWNESHYDNPQVNELIDKISEEIDDEKRLAYYHELQEIFFEDGPLINVQVPLLVALSNKVLHYRQPLTMIPQYKYTDIEQ